MSAELGLVLYAGFLCVLVLGLRAFSAIMSARRRPDRNDTLPLSQSERMLTDQTLANVTQIAGYDAKVRLIQDVGGLTSKVVGMFARVEVQVPELEGVVIDKLGREGSHRPDHAHTLWNTWFVVCEDEQVRMFTLTPDVIAELVSAKSVTLDLDTHALFSNSEDDAARDPVGRLFVNQYVLLEHPDDGQSAFGRVSHVSEDGQHATLSRLKPAGDTVWGIKPRNKEQLFALDALLDESIDLVTLVGKAGTGKTLIALCAGLKQVTDDQRHHKLLVSRPVVPMGRDIGFLPGTMEEKLGPWMRPIFDNVEYLMGLSRADKRAGRGADELIDMGLIELEALTYIRGRSLPNQYMIIDEAQNLTPHEVKTVLTRVGEGTKIVLTGDPQQIDNPYVDSESNGLSYVIERFKGQERAASVTLFKGERSALAELAADLL